MKKRRPKRDGASDREVSGARRVLGGFLGRSLLSLGGSGLSLGLGGLLGLLGLALGGLLLLLQLLLAALRLLLGSGGHGGLAGGLGLGLLGAGLLRLRRRLLVSGDILGGHHGVGQAHDAALAVGGLVLVDDALGGGLVHQTAGLAGEGVGVLAVALGHGVLDVTDGGLQLALDGAVAHTTLLVGNDALLLGLDVSHEC